MRRNHPTTKSLPSTREFIEILTPRYGAFDKLIQRTKKADWEVYNDQNRLHGSPQKNMRREKVILLDSHWASIAGNHSNAFVKSEFKGIKSGPVHLHQNLLRKVRFINQLHSDRKVPIYKSRRVKKVF